MSPTNELRYVLRPVPAFTTTCLDSATVYRFTHVLQQKWVEDRSPYAWEEPVVEWRDVPTVQEGA